MTKTFGVWLNAPSSRGRGDARRGSVLLGEARGGAPKALPPALAGVTSNGSLFGSSGSSPDAKGKDCPIGGGTKPTAGADPRGVTGSVFKGDAPGCPLSAGATGSSFLIPPTSPEALLVSTSETP